jgi:hypothetical protein
MSQVLQKPYECYGCKQQIRISKIDNVQPGQKKQWLQFEMDGITVHVCKKKEQEQPSSSTTTIIGVKDAPIEKIGSKLLVPNSDITKEIAAIKAQLLVFVSRLDRIEKELQTHVS